jgi:hypothetical protein
MRSLGKVEKILQNSFFIPNYSRLLKPGGKFIYITFGKLDAFLSHCSLRTDPGQPHFRKRHIERKNTWLDDEIHVTKIGTYICSYISYPFW